MLSAFSLIGLLTWSFWFVRAISEGWKQWGSMSLNEAWKGFSIRVTFINLKAGSGRIKIYSFVPYQWEMTRNTLKKLSCFWEEDMITYLYSSTSVFFVWRALLPWMAKPPFFSPHGCILGALDQLQRSDCGTGILVQLLVFTFFTKMKVHYFAFQRFQVCNQLIGISPCNHIGPFTRIVQLKKKSCAFFFWQGGKKYFPIKLLRSYHLGHNHKRTSVFSLRI